MYRYTILEYGSDYGEHYGESDSHHNLYRHMYGEWMYGNGFSSDYRDPASNSASVASVFQYDLRGRFCHDIGYELCRYCTVVNRSNDQFDTGCACCGHHIHSYVHGEWMCQCCFNRCDDYPGYGECSGQCRTGDGLCWSVKHLDSYRLYRNFILEYRSNYSEYHGKSNRDNNLHGDVYYSAKLPSASLCDGNSCACCDTTNDYSE